jgi:hypothetical protein
MPLVVAKDWERLLDCVDLLLGQRLNLVADCGQKSGINFGVDANTSSKLPCKLTAIICSDVVRYFMFDNHKF